MEIQLSAMGASVRARSSDGTSEFHLGDPIPIDPNANGTGTFKSSLI